MPDETKPGENPQATDQGTNPPQTQDQKIPEATEQTGNQKQSQKELIEQGIVVPPPKKEEPKPDTDSFTKIDPNTLPAELQPIYKSMQGDYTRAKQALSGKGEITEQDKQGILTDVLNNLTDQQFETASQHPVFINRLMSYLNKQGLTPGQQQAQDQQEDPLKEDLDLADPVTKKLYEQNQEMMKVIQELKGRVDSTDVATRNAAIQAEDARLQSKYKGNYDPNQVNSFLNQVSQGQTELTRELIHRAINYERDIKNAYRWGQEESYSENPNKGNSSLLSSMQQGGNSEAHEAPKPQKGENRLTYFQRLWENSKQKLANGQQSQWVTQR